MSNEVNIQSDQSLISDLTEKNTNVEQTIFQENENLVLLMDEEIQFNTIIDSFKRNIEEIQTEMENDNTQILEIIDKLNTIEIEQTYTEFENLKTKLSELIFHNTSVKEKISDINNEIILHKDKINNLYVIHNNICKENEILEKKIKDLNFTNKEFTDDLEAKNNLINIYVSTISKNKVKYNKLNDDMVSHKNNTK